MITPTKFGQNPASSLGRDVPRQVLCQLYWPSANDKGHYS